MVSHCTGASRGESKGCLGTRAHCVPGGDLDTEPLWAGSVLFLGLDSLSGLVCPSPRPCESDTNPEFDLQLAPDSKPFLSGWLGQVPFPL